MYVESWKQEFPLQSSGFWGKTQQRRRCHGVARGGGIGRRWSGATMVQWAELSMALDDVGELERWRAWSKTASTSASGGAWCDFIDRGRTRRCLGSPDSGRNQRRVGWLWSIWMRKEEVGCGCVPTLNGEGDDLGKVRAHQCNLSIQDRVWVYYFRRETLKFSISGKFTGIK